MQWEAIEDEAKEVYRQRIPVLFIPFSGLTPEEEAIRDQRGPYDRLVAADLHRGLYEGSDPGQDECEPEAPTMRHPYNVNPLSVSTAVLFSRERNIYPPPTFRFENGCAQSSTLKARGRWDQKGLRLD